MFDLVDVLLSDDIIKHNAEPETGSNGDIESSVKYVYYTISLFTLSHRKHNQKAERYSLYTGLTFGHNVKS